ncbi:LysR family transcriptional regulator [Loktanella sp. SALINAS62]|uniref:LysR family transcriptional regulator n=1 Tax=Loktanella sp. SALINAS62 TaxID=2706124 RepID=UPI001B8B1467|nr:LysR family transcriptional regulator [Loktanella sp. SALINAS62]MBS1302912.1 LysR family transcriptional regulator [Loktanella sp. SALINAS62]
MSFQFASRLKPAHLRLIRAIQDTGKLQLAAETVAMSQPAASRLLADIESEIGGALFERLPRGMSATPLGDAFLRHARVILSEFDALSDNIAKLQGGQAGTVRVGSVTGPAVSALVPALLAVRDIAPDIQPTVEVAPSVVLLRGLEEGRFDFVLARIGADRDPRNLHAHSGRTERILLLAGRDHPLAGRKVGLADTLAYDFVIQEPGSPIRTALERSFLESGLPTPDRVTNSSSLLVALSLITSSHAIAPQTEEVAQMLSQGNSGLGIIEVAEEITVSPFLVLQTADRPLTPIAQRLLQEVLRRL